MNITDVLNDIQRYKLPVIVKPVDSSGSKGATVLYSWECLKDAVEAAFSFSRCNRIIIEEFIEKKHKFLIGGDIFVLNGNVTLWGLMNCHRDNKVNSLVPIGKSYPLELENGDINKVKDTLQDLVNKLYIKDGAMNVELIVDKNDDVWLIDVGPRNGGNMIPDLLGYIFNINVVEMSIKVAMGDAPDISKYKPVPFYATHNLHSDKNGIFDKIIFFIIITSLFKLKVLF